MLPFAPQRKLVSTYENAKETRSKKNLTQKSLCLRLAVI
jgi:hypothetical protein